MKRIKQLLVALALVVGMGVMLTPTTAGAVNVFDDTCTANPDSTICKNKGETVQPLITIIVNTLLYFIGAVSVIMIIIGGIKYTVSNGDASGVTSAKNTILYSIVGLVVAFMAYAIVNWVVVGFANAATASARADAATQADCKHTGGTWDFGDDKCK